MKWAFGFLAHRREEPILRHIQHSVSYYMCKSSNYHKINISSGIMNSSLSQNSNLASQYCSENLRFVTPRQIYASSFRHSQNIYSVLFFFIGMVFKSWEWLLSTFSWRWEVMGKALLHSTEGNEGGWYIDPRSHSATEETRHRCYYWIRQSHLEWSGETTCSQGVYVFENFATEVILICLFLKTENQ